jgi:starch-binding outer membrane protein, SusD/RagB family
MKNIKFISFLISIILFTSCNKLETFPFDSLKRDDFNSLQGIQLLSSGIYSNLSSGNDKAYIDFSNNSSDDFAKVNNNNSSEPGSFATNQMYPLINGTLTWPLWTDFYKNIFVCNTVILQNTFGTDIEKNNAIAEMYFLRAYNYYILSNFFTRPYTQKDISNLGLPLRLNPDDKSEATRSTIDDLYNQMIADLKMASLYMKPINTDRTKASKQAAQALLARIYNSMLQPLTPDVSIANNAINYADSVLNSGKVSMITASDIFFGNNTIVRTQRPSLTKHYFSSAQSYSETIWMLYRTAVTTLPLCIDADYNQKSTGQYLPLSNDYFNLLNKYPTDLRNNLIDKTYTPVTGTTIAFTDAVYKANSTNCNKYSFQGGVTDLGSSIVLRATELLLIKAEAYAKLGDITNALVNINIVRRRAGVPEFTVANWNANNYKITNLLDLVLNEKRLEMVGECQRTKDLYRNKKDIIRTYAFSGANLLEAFPTAGTGTISRWDSKAIIAPIPYGQILQAPNMVQNPY